METACKVQKLKSRRHRVELVEEAGLKKIRKVFCCDPLHDKDLFKTEVFMLEHLKGKLPVPKILACGQTAEGEDFLELEYVDGVLLSDAFLDGKVEDVPMLARLTAKFFKDFEKEIPGFYLDDINLRNFLIKDGICWSVDFEEVAAGEISLSVAKMIVFVSFYKTDNVRIRTFSRVLASEMGFAVSENLGLLESEAKALAKRRNIAVPYGDILDVI